MVEIGKAAAEKVMMLMILIDACTRCGGLLNDMIAEIVYITNLIVALRQTTEEWCELWKYYLLS